jgi:hypothetical protein
MATVLEMCTTKEQCSDVLFCGQKDWMQRIFLKKCSLFMLGSVCCVKRFTNWWQIFRWWRRGWNGGAEVAETTVKRHVRCGFGRIGKAMGQVYRYWWRVWQKIIFPPGSNITCFTFYNRLWPIYWLCHVLRANIVVFRWHYFCFALSEKWL